MKEILVFTISFIYLIIFYKPANLGMVLFMAIVITLLAMIYWELPTN